MYIHICMSVCTYIHVYMFSISENGIILTQRTTNLPSILRCRCPCGIQENCYYDQFSVNAQKIRQHIEPSSKKQCLFVIIVHRILHKTL